MSDDEEENRNVVEKETVFVENEDEVLDSLEKELEEELMKNCPDKDNPTYYVNNQKLLSHLREYESQCQEAETNDEPLPRVPEYVGMCLIKIAERYSMDRKFINYPYREELVGDAIENSLRYIRSFDTTQDNPFAYFTMCMHRAFIRRIEKEKKQLYVKALKVRRMDTIDKSFDSMEETEEGEEIGKLVNTYVDYLQENCDDIINNFEAKLKKKRERVAQRKREIKTKNSLKLKAKPRNRDTK